VDFNQGIDARLLTEEKIRLISEIAVKPLRVAFDDIKYKDIYIEKVRLAAKYKIKIFSNYILFNYKDKPEDFYERLKINIELNEEFALNGLETRIWSFPMRYTPIEGEEAKERKYVGKYWNKKFLRGIQCILIATHGVVGNKREFFERAFGKDYNEFSQILMLPEDFIILRKKFQHNQTGKKLHSLFQELNESEKREVETIIQADNFTDIQSLSENLRIQNILKFYQKRKHLWKIENHV
jgi:hypothetical protein